jgi:hypothetical protein
MQVPQTHRSSLTDNADGERSETIIPKFLSKLKYRETKYGRNYNTNKRL